MKFIGLFILLHLSFTPLVLGQAEAFSQSIDQYFKGILASSPAPGFSVVVVKDEKVVFKKGYGVERIGSPNLMTAKTSASIGSLTKSFTALAIMQLVEQGKIRLDDPVIKYLPEFKTANRNRSDKITVRMLLNNTSGLQGGVSNRLQDEEEALELLLQSLQSFYLSKEPGKSYEYTNTGFSVAGLIIERVSGLSYSKYLEQRILQPLEMERTSTDPNDFDDLKVLYGHWMGLNEGIPAERGIESVEMTPAGSMLRSSSTDLGNYLIALLNGGCFKGQQLLSEQSIHTMWTPQVNFPGISYEMGGDGKDFQYGLGWMISEVEERTLIHHGGSRGTMSSMTVLFPEKRLAASILFNLDYNYLNRYRFQSEFNILNNLFHLIENEELTDFGIPRVPDPTLNDYQLPTHLQERVLGTYWFSGKGDTRNFQGVTLQVFKNNGGNLEAQMNRSKTVLNHFALDFSNEVNALSRNIGNPVPIRLKVRPDGTVTAIYYGGSEFKKTTSALLAKYKQIETDAFSFYFPDDWNWNFRTNSFKASLNSDPELLIVGGQSDNPNTELKFLITQHFPDFNPFYEGIEKTEVRGPHFWRQQSFASLPEKNNCQQIVLMNTTVGFYLILNTPSGMLTTEVQANLSLLMDTFTEL